MDHRDRDDWHRLSEAELLSLLETSQQEGLSREQVAKRLTECGLNELTQRGEQSPLLLFARQFNQPLVYILLGAVLVTSLLGEWIDAGVIFAVVLINAIIGFVQESRALKAIRALSRAMTSEISVVRQGRKQRLSSSQLVPGDIVLLQSGDKIPADLRLLRSRELRVDESALTGESLPVEKAPAILPGSCILAERSNMAFGSTLITSGTATGIVVATGDRSEIGRINQLIATTEVLATPLTRRIAHFSQRLLYVILGLAALSFGVGLLRGESWIDMFMASVALAVGAIPEGLPAALTITLAIGVAKMAQRHAIIRKLPAAETLGSTTVICSDKTGTLTQNQMTVQALQAGTIALEVSGVGYSPEGTFRHDGQACTLEEYPALHECLLAGLLCNDARLVKSEKGWRIDGDPTEGALITVARKAGLDSEILERQLPRLDTIPFESQHQYMASLHRRGHHGQVIYLKGSAERILEKCDRTLDDAGKPGELDRGHWLAEVEALAERGMRVLAFARLEPRATHDRIGHEDVASGLTFLGLQGMLDPPRDEAVEAVLACQKAGIQVKMITGDHGITATAIARKIGLGGNPQVSAVRGRELAEMDPDQFSETAEQAVVFARVAPEQKLQLVEALQSRGHVVAMTGDGVNDAPALRRADIGVAMGITGTEVAKEAADMVLTDDNFASIRAAVEEGRGVYDNLIKFITWTLPTNLGEGLVILTAILAGVTLPILPVQILWINMTTAILLGLMLAFEPKEPGIMERPPRDPKARILTPPLLFRIGIVGLLLLLGSFGLFQWSLNQGESEAVARTITVNVFVCGEIFYLFNCRSLRYSMLHQGLFSNPWLLLGVATMILLQLLYTYAPVMNAIMGSAPIRWSAWGPIIAVGVAVYFIIGLEKWLSRRIEARSLTARD